ncbi:unnamed protein product [Durusdinium trenchii]|uniref:Slow skeletal and cardiac muscles (TN-C) n=2 Tax=Durusdinium trenchii TaxID=1381693 RepID=A0ABP0PH65_9DINO
MAEAEEKAKDGQSIIEIFKKFDTNSDGVISKEELTQLLNALGPEMFTKDSLETLLSAMDSNNDGKVQYAEFVHWLTGEDEDEAHKVWSVTMPGKMLPKGALARLDAIIGMSPHLSGNVTYQDARKALDKGEEKSAFLLSDKLLLQLEADANRIDAAFIRFDYSGSGTLDASEVAAMFQYLGFPNPEEDDGVKALVKKLDKATNEEFKHFVEEFGGCDALFERRRARALRDRATTSGSSTSLSSLPREEIQEHMLCAGIEKDAQAYWELILPPSELENVCLLTGCQKKAVCNIRQIAKVNHQNALPVLQRRVASLGFKDMDLWTTLSWVRDFAPLIIHIHFDKMCRFLLEDTHYRSQFETGSSCGLNNREVRDRWERDLFQGAYTGCRDFERPKYGVLNVHNDYRGVVRAKQYGDCYMVLKDARLRTTFSPEDSANLKAERLACLDYYAHVLVEYTDDELRETLKVATTGKLGSSDAILAKELKYKEAQFHGEVAFARHVERLVLPKVDKYIDREDDIKAVCSKNGWEWCWMEEEKERREKLEAEDKASDDKINAWRAKLKAMAEGPNDDVTVPAGFCKKGCGKPVAPGLTKNGNPYKTCCRGCALGFGHDLRCGLKAGERPPCKMNCGMLAAPGTTSKGRPLDTCCRGCAKGGDHDARCHGDPAD